MASPLSLSVCCAGARSWCGAVALTTGRAGLLSTVQSAAPFHAICLDSGTGGRSNHIQTYSVEPRHSPGCVGSFEVQCFCASPSGRTRFANSLQSQAPLSLEAFVAH